MLLKINDILGNEINEIENRIEWNNITSSFLFGLFGRNTLKYVE